MRDSPFRVIVVVREFLCGTTTLVRRECLPPANHVSLYNPRWDGVRKVYSKLPISRPFGSWFISPRELGKIFPASQISPENGWGTVEFVTIVARKPLLGNGIQHYAVFSLVCVISRLRVSQRCPLRPRDELIVKLRRKGWSYREIGEAVGMSPTSVGYALARIAEGGPVRPLRH